MNDFPRQYAIRLPDGSMFVIPEPPPNPFLAGLFNRNQPDHQPVVAIFDGEEVAQVILESLREGAQKIGVPHLGAAVVSRVVGPWGEPDLTGFMAAIEGHANGAQS